MKPSSKSTSKGSSNYADFTVCGIMTVVLMSIGIPTPLDVRTDESMGKAEVPQVRGEEEEGSRSQEGMHLYITQFIHTPSSPQVYALSFFRVRVCARAFVQGELSP